MVQSFLTIPTVQGEAFDFGTPVVIDGAVEVWMSAVEKEMRSTLHRSVVQCSCMQPTLCN